MSLLAKHWTTVNIKNNNIFLQNSEFGGINLFTFVLK